MCPLVVLNSMQHVCSTRRCQSTPILVEAQSGVSALHGRAAADGRQGSRRGPHPCVCCMTSGAMKQGVPQKVLRARYFWAAHAFWNCPMLPPLAALLGLSARQQRANQISALHIDRGLPPWVRSRPSDPYPYHDAEAVQALSEVSRQLSPACVNAQRERVGTPAASLVEAWE